MNANSATKPGMMAITHFAKNGPVGVLKPRCTTTSERIGHWRKIRLSLVRFSGPDASNRIPSSADSITTMPGFKFSVRTPANVNPTEIDAIRRAMTPMVATPHGGDWSKVESFHVEDKEPGKTSGKIRGICRCCRSLTSVRWAREKAPRMPRDGFRNHPHIRSPVPHRQGS